MTLAEVLGTQVVAGLTLNSMELKSSPLGGIPLADIALGGMPLGGIPLGGIANSPDAGSTCSPRLPVLAADDLWRRHRRSDRGDVAFGLELVHVRPRAQSVQVRLGDGEELAEHVPAAELAPE